MLTDPIADCLTRLRNAATAGNRFTDVNGSSVIQHIIEILKAQGFVADFLVKEEKGQKRLRVFLKYGANRRPLLNGLRRISSCGARRYVSADKIPHVRSGLGFAVISTSQGVMTGHEARKRGIGGEVFCLVW